jgi:hypothetical protein
MKLKTQIENIQLVYLGLLFLWGLAVIFLQEWRSELSLCTILGLTWRGFAIERELRPTTENENIRDRQHSPRHARYYTEELGLVLVAITVVAATQLLLTVRM